MKRTVPGGALARAVRCGAFCLPLRMPVSREDFLVPKNLEEAYAFALLKKMSHVVIATFHFTSEANRQKFLDILASPDGLAKTRAWPGCKLIECCLPAADNQVVLYERWDKQEDHESYMEMRKESGMFDLLAGLLEGGMEGLKVERFKLHDV